MPSIIRQRQALDTLTAVELDKGEMLDFVLRNGGTRRLTLRATGAEVTNTTLPELGVEVKGGVTNYRFWCELEVDGVAHTLEREVATQASFYEPWEIDGMRIWLDAVDDIFAFLRETHGPCRPRRAARFALQDAALRICPDRVHPWCPLPAGGLRIEDCYNGEDCWMGAYFGASAHGGLDINHPAGTPLRAPIDIHDHFFFNSVAAGDNNNRWRGLHYGPDGSIWVLQSHHQLNLHIPEHEPFAAGTHYTDGAGVWVGSHEHSHFAFKVVYQGDEVLLDPWILFRQMYLDL
jgi:hypothetical protein